MDNFTPISATIGGALIGLAATLLWLANGRLAGISGIAGGLVPSQAGDGLWRVLFILGLPIGALIGADIGPALFAEIPSSKPTLDAATPLLVAAALLVGIGTRLGGGCTSGHGICGLSRLSIRSFAAVLVFMACAAATVFVARHVIG